MDPAGPSFEGANSSQRLDGTDAELVDVIHTAGQPLGIHKAVSWIKAISWASTGLLLRFPKDTIKYILGMLIYF